MIGRGGTDGGDRKIFILQRSQCRCYERKIHTVYIEESIYIYIYITSLTSIGNVRISLVRKRPYQGASHETGETQLRVSFRGVTASGGGDVDGASSVTILFRLPPGTALPQVDITSTGRGWCLQVAADGNMPGGQDKARQTCKDKTSPEEREGAPTNPSHIIHLRESVAATGTWHFQPRDPRPCEQVLLLDGANAHGRERKRNGKGGIHGDSAM